MLHLALVLLSLQAGDTTGTSAPPPDSYADSTTAALVARFRAARERNERLVTSYTVTAKQRIGVGIRALSRDRMLYRQELVARITWFRDRPSAVEVVGAREAVPVAGRGDRLPEELDDPVRSLVLNPAEDYLRLVGGDDEGFVYPLREGGEADYRFRTSDTTTIRLPTGRTIRLIALEVIPRRPDWRLMAGKLWFDDETDGLVRAVFRPARPFEFRRDADESDREDVPAFVNPVAEVRFVTMEYGLYEERWWLPRYIAVDAVGSQGSWLNIPVRFERTYEDYEVTGGSPPDAGATFRAAGTIRRRERAATDADTSAEARAERHRPAKDTNLVVVVPADTLALLSSPELGDPILQMGDLISEQEIRGLAGAIRQLPDASGETRLQVPASVGMLARHVRYNRIEALSVGADATLNAGRAVVAGKVRIGVADLVPNAELGVSRATLNGRFGVNAYYRLNAANPDVRPFGLVNSFFSVVAQRDDGEYYRTLGAEVTAGNTNAGWWSARGWFERQYPVSVETQASLPHVFSSSNVFRPNISADSADQAGASLTLRGTRFVSRAVMLGGETTLDGAVGSFDYGRAAATLRLFVMPAGPVSAALTASAGTSTGAVPVQSRFYLGGAPNLRGFHGGVAAGDAFWAGRAEVARNLSVARLVLFSDVGWAGPRADFRRGRALVGAGVGGSLLDGLIRMDLAYGFSEPGTLRLELYLDGVL